ncbi:hypothetical protein PAPYR_10379 [Paratrimastix pyriformis]|uniref:TmcB/TmcC TPR repeats domain-containing protein n=1 Tax=Paratrimastix pyriformis TaxID=342808 RepID=A0ABQ8UA98_9EUKA|nr:hypothetical protein PAPYR_10379 [Paratrimastix pyriformis]
MSGMNIRFTRLEEAIFGLYFSMVKDQSEAFKKINLANLLVMVIQMVAISFHGTEWPLGFFDSYLRTFFSLLDLSISTGSLISLHIVFSLVCLFIVSAIADAGIVAWFFGKNYNIPLLPIKILRVLTISMVTFLYMPCVSVLFSILDCYYIGVPEPVHAIMPNLICWDFPHMVFSIVALVILVVFVPFSQFTSLLPSHLVLDWGLLTRSLFNNDPRKGGLLARPDGRIDFLAMQVSSFDLQIHCGGHHQAADAVDGLPPGGKYPGLCPSLVRSAFPLICKFIVVATTKLMTRYTVFRKVVSTLGYAFLALYCLWSQPYYSIRGSALVQLRGPKFRTSHQVEQAVRFLQLPQYRTSDYVAYADALFTDALKSKRLRTDVRLHVNYAIFLKYSPSFDERFIVYMKYKDWEQQTSKKVRRSEPGFSCTDPPHSAHSVVRARGFSCTDPLNRLFLHYCYSGIICLAFRSLCNLMQIASISQTHIIISYAGAELRSAHVMSVFTYKRHFGMAQKYHGLAREKLEQLCAALLGHTVDCRQVSQLTCDIVTNEASAREYYELLLQSHPNSVQVLRAYGSLLHEIYTDDRGDALFAQADAVEEANAVCSLPPGFVETLFAWVSLLPCRNRMKRFLQGPLFCTA